MILSPNQMVLITTSCFSRKRAVFCARSHHRGREKLLCTHTVDQFYYILAGEVALQIGNATHHAAKDTLVYLPAGVAHRHWNPGALDEMHLEILAPMPSPLLPLLHPVTSNESAPFPNPIRPFDPTTWDKASDNARMAVQWLARSSSGSPHLVLNVALVPPGGRGPELHIHEFDQCYFVLAGEMTVAIAGKVQKLKPYDLAFLPAGIPHRQWNEGSEPESHLTMNIPDPNSEASQWSLLVDFALRGSA
jgi:mannose-6-phosphate isomerase-like protein (cupin superfamily)